MSDIREVTFSKLLELDFSGRVVEKSITLGDIDNDSRAEFIVGDTQGNLSIYKYQRTTPIFKASSLGSISCIGVGKLESLNDVGLFVVSMEGECFIFSGMRLAAFSDKMKTLELKPYETCRAKVVNSATSLKVADWNKHSKVVLGTSDRCLYVYEYDSVHKKLKFTTRFHLTYQLRSMWPVPSMATEERKLPILCGFNRGTLSIFEHGKLRIIKESEIAQAMPLSVRELGMCDGKLDMLLCYSNGDVFIQSMDPDSLELEVKQELSLNKMLLPPCVSADRKIIALCSWDGRAYILNRNGLVVAHDFRRTVNAFRAGFYDTGEDSIEFCIFVALQEGGIVVLKCDLDLLFPSGCLKEHSAAREWILYNSSDAMLRMDTLS